MPEAARHEGLDRRPARHEARADTQAQAPLQARTVIELYPVAAFRVIVDPALHHAQRRQRLEIHGRPEAVKAIASIQSYAEIARIERA